MQEISTVGFPCKYCEEELHHKCTAESLVDVGKPLNSMSIPGMTESSAKYHCFCFSTNHKQTWRKKPWSEIKELTNYKKESELSETT